MTIHQIPWPIRRLYYFIKCLFYINPIKYMKVVGRACRLNLPPRSVELHLLGHKFLRDALEVCQALDIKPFLVFGTLLGCVRDGGFIRQDHDIDLGLLPGDYAKRNLIREAMFKKGYGLRLEGNYEVSFTFPGMSEFCLDFYKVYPLDGNMAMSISEDPRAKLVTFHFPPDMFSSFKKAPFAGMGEVMIPEQAELFLEKTYGDWHTPPKKKYDFTQDAKNTTIVAND